MLIRTHLALGIFIALVSSFYFPISFGFLLIILLGSIVPDLDSSSSSYGRHLVFRPFQLFFRHRGVWHSLLVGAILSLAVNYFYFGAGIWFFIGFFAHLFLDCFTKQGVMLFWPIGFRVRGVFRSGGRFDELLFLVLVTVNILLIFLKIGCFNC